LEDKPERDYASGESAEFSDLELDPEIELLNQVSADAVSIPVEIEPETNIFADPEPAGMLTADRLLQDKAKPNFIPETFWRRFTYRITSG